MLNESGGREMSLLQKITDGHRQKQYGRVIAGFSEKVDGFWAVFGLIELVGGEYEQVDADH